MATLAGKTRCVTGASRGIGREIALRAAGVDDFPRYPVTPGVDPFTGLLID